MKSPSKNLTDIHERLTATLGDKAPSYITLRRHAKAGLLDRFFDPRSTREGRRPLYKVGPILNYYRAILVQSNQEEPVTVPAGSPNSPAPEPISTSAIEPPSHHVATDLSGVTASLTRIQNGLSNLDSVRLMLMRKYDAENAALKEENARLREEVKRYQALIKGGDTERLLGQVLIRLQRLEDTFSRPHG